MAKIRHIAYRAEDTEAMAKFFVEAFEMKVAQRRGNGAIDLTDGTINITLLPAKGVGASGHIGIDHMGFTVADEAETQRKVEAAGGRESNAINLGGAFYEKKYVGPEGIVVDVGHWVATAPIEEAQPATANA
jgi:catechol 2,3-dioxygenase-like lactoylglutathione lyase family enzyme